jgi:hypothetical protein
MPGFLQDTPMAAPDNAASNSMRRPSVRAHQKTKKAS